MARLSNLGSSYGSFLVVTIAVCTVLGRVSPTQGASASLTKVVIGYPSPTPRVAPLWIAQDLDFFGKYGLTAQLVLVRNNQMLTAGLAAGDIAVGYTGGTTVLGAAAAGLHALAEGLPGFDELVERQRRPPLRLEEGRMLARVAHALVDLSDGIVTDAGHVAERSGCRIEIEVERLPLAPGIAAVGPEPFWTLGEDYELLAALDPADADALGLTVVGRCVEGSGVALLERGEPLDVKGFDHFVGGG